MKETVRNMKESSHCSNGFISAWFLLILLYVCTVTMVYSINVSNTMQTLENMEAYDHAFVEYAPVISDVRCKVEQGKDEEGNLDLSPYSYQEETRAVTAVCGDDTILITLNEEETFIVSYTIIH